MLFLIWMSQAKTFLTKSTFQSATFSYSKTTSWAHSHQKLRLRMYKSKFWKSRWEGLRSMTFARAMPLMTTVQSWPTSSTSSKASHNKEKTGKYQTKTLWSQLQQERPQSSGRRTQSMKVGLVAFFFSQGVTIFAFSPLLLMSTALEAFPLILPQLLRSWWAVYHGIQFNDC